MRIGKKIAILVVCLLALGNMAYAADKDKLIGGWELVSVKSLETGDTSSFSNAHLIITKKYFMIFFGGNDRKKIDKPPIEKTKEELLDMAKFQLRFGSYTVSGNKMSNQIIRANDPVSEGTKGLMREFRFEGEDLILKYSTVEGRYRRIE